MVKIKLPNGEIIKARVGERILDKIPKNSGLVARVNGKLIDLSMVIKEDLKLIEVLDFNSEEGKMVYWHTSSHILAHAVKRLFPNAKLGMGPPIENGFYYDFDVGGYAFTPEDLKKIEKEMKKKPPSREKKSVIRVKVNNKSINVTY